ncbi:MAG: YIP1 family protein [Acidobacteriota bacterium]|nr:YIP1 family protein [Acidobacteriota bacterium]
MNIVERVKRILVSPATEWPVIAAETTPTAALVTGYVVPLAALSAVATFIGQSLVGVSLMGTTYRTPIATGIAMAIWGMVMAVAGVFICAYIINAFAPTFGATKSDSQALKVAAYSFTPVWVAGLLQILPPLSPLSIIGALYALYLLYLGLGIVMKAPDDKTVGYTAVVALVTVVALFVIIAIGGMLLGAAALSTNRY